MFSRHDQKEEKLITQHHEVYKVYIAPVSSKKFLDIQENIECGFTLKCVRDMIRTCSTMKQYINKTSLKKNAENNVSKKAFL